MVMSSAYRLQVEIVLIYQVAIDYFIINSTVNIYRLQAGLQNQNNSLNSQNSSPSNSTRGKNPYVLVPTFKFHVRLFFSAKRSVQNSFTQMHFVLESYKIKGGIGQSFCLLQCKKKSIFFFLFNPLCKYALHIKHGK